MKRPTWREALAKEKPLVLAGAHDALSARLIEQVLGSDVVAVFAQAPSGDQNPLYSRIGSRVPASALSGAASTPPNMPCSRPCSA